MRSHRESDLEPRHLGSQASVPCILSSFREPAWGAELPGRGLTGRTRELPRSSSAGFLGCLHSGQATMSPRRPWPSSGCWKSEPSRTSRTSDWAGAVPIRLLTLPSAPVRGCGGCPVPAWTQPPLRGEEARSETRLCPWLLWWRPDRVRVAAVRQQEPGQGTGLVAVASPLCQRREII